MTGQVQPTTQRQDADPQVLGQIYFDESQGHHFLVYGFQPGYINVYLCGSTDLARVRTEDFRNGVSDGVIIWASDLSALITCPACGGAMEVIGGQDGPFVACTSCPHADSL